MDVVLIQIIQSNDIHQAHAIIVSEFHVLFIPKPLRVDDYMQALGIIHSAVLDVQWTLNNTLVEGG
ncbi:hypothetical protein BO71DRAFT_403459 [Aspergillus ellipticus CBS 707.79]|uniref:Uncharacterized protein n=1 Tax=Aspergillus ellipticus CBS 707.79 TaxID=1448320 RepID=A0A319CWE7_9EURO|nr:hypothetical protein BO71DRAFT_403459 [Aspergillus ellipticus CBS 707.79]